LHACRTTGAGNHNDLCLR